MGLALEVDMALFFIQAIKSLLSKLRERRILSVLSPFFHELEK